MNIRLDNTLYSSSVSDLTKKIPDSFLTKEISEDDIFFKNRDNTEQRTEEIANFHKISKEELQKIHDASTMNADEVKNFLFMLIGADVKVEETNTITGVNINKYV